MSPTLSMAMLPIQRKVESGENVPCWITVGVPLVRLPCWYQRTPTWEFFRDVPTVTEWFTTATSPPAGLRYAKRYIKRSASESSFWRVLGCATQAPPPLHAAVNAATGTLIGPVRVEFDGVVKSTWKRQIFRELVPKFTNTLGAPAGGAVEPSRSDGSNPPKLGLNWKHT